MELKDLSATFLPLMVTSWSPSLRPALSKRLPLALLKKSDGIERFQITKENGPMANAGIRKNDQLVAINNVSIQGKSHKSLVKEISAQTNIKLTVQREIETPKEVVTIDVNRETPKTKWGGDLLRRDEVKIFQNITKGGVMDNAGIKDNDLLLGINDETIVGKSLKNIGKKMHDQTNLKLTVLREKNENKEDSIYGDTLPLVSFKMTRPLSSGEILLYLLRTLFSFFLATACFIGGVSELNCP
jgi:C-terminal processing protease CtpA/Prc